MKRRDFFKKGTTVAVAASVIPLTGTAAPTPVAAADRQTDQWLNLGSGKKIIPGRKLTLNYDVAVLGGGLAGMCAAVSARNNFV